MGRGVNLAATYKTQRGSSRLPRTKEQLPVTPSRPSQVRPKIGFSVVQYFDGRNETEYNRWQIYTEAYQIKNSKQLSTIKDFGKLAIKLVSSEEISGATEPLIGDFPEEKQQRHYKKMQQKLTEFLVDQPLLRLDPEEEDQNWVYRAPTNEYIYEVLPEVQLTNGQRTIGHALSSRLLPRLRNQVLGFLEDKFELSIDSAPSSAGIDYRLDLWPVNDNCRIEDLRLKAVEPIHGPPTTISMHRPEVAS